LKGKHIDWAKSRPSIVPRVYKYFSTMSETKFRLKPDSFSDSGGEGASGEFESTSNADPAFMIMVQSRSSSQQKWLVFLGIEA
jgi:hypothetical protein